MSKGKTLLKDTFIYGIGNFGSRLLGFLLLPFYTGIFSKRDYGYLDLILMGSTLFIVVVSLKLFEGAYRFLWDAKTEEERRDMVSSVLNLILLNFLLLSGVCFIVFKLTGFEFLYGGLIFFWLLIRLFGEYFQQAARAFGKNHIFSVSGIVLAVSMLLLNFLFLGCYKFKVAGFIWAMVISHLLSLVYCVYAGSFITYYRPNKLSSKIIIPLLKYSLPLLPTAVSWWLIRVAGRYFLSYFHGLELVGIYAVSDKLPVMLYMINMTFYMAWQDMVIRHFNDKGKDDFLSGVMATYVRIGLSIVTIITVLLKPFFMLMVNGAYHEAHIYVPWLLVAVFVLCLAGLYDVFFMGAKKTTGILVSALIAAACSILFNILFVKNYGIWATTVSTFLSAVVLLGVRVYQLRQQVNIRFNYKEILFLLILWAMACIIYKFEGWSYWISVLLISGLIIRINFDNIKSLFEILRWKLLQNSIEKQT